MLRAESGRRHEHGERARRVLDEGVAVRQRPVQEALGVALVDVQVAKARGAEEPAVRDRASGEEDRCSGEGGQERISPPRGHAERLLHLVTGPAAARAAARAEGAAARSEGAEAARPEGAAEEPPAAAAAPCPWSSGSRSRTSGCSSRWAEAARRSTRTGPWSTAATRPG